ncbi:flagellar biosynthetic protein FliO [Mangrovibacter yixingensis]|uniref:flagellar biosynthetic protein FliO n=1 Tax=Mangrovibacter yixingensis TaxID=1529639 RepID=UPI001CFC225E|nr:flagellar biosynthetic protein FliO [Mangrovibacter yixingensis]
MANQTSAVVAQDVSSPATSLVQVSAALCVIIVLILGIAWFAKRFGFTPRHGSARGLKVTASVTVGQREKVVIVDVENARLVLGVTPTQITHLHTLPPSVPDEEETHGDGSPESRQPHSFQDALKTILKRQGKQ